MIDDIKLSEIKTLRDEVQKGRPSVYLDFVNSVMKNIDQLIDSAESALKMKEEISGTHKDINNDQLVEYANKIIACLPFADIDRGITETQECMRELVCRLSKYDSKTFPILEPLTRKPVIPHPLRIPWSVAELAYSVYRSQYGSGQTLERIAERGGFSPAEMDEFVPDWRERCSEIESLRIRLKETENDRDKWMQDHHSECVELQMARTEVERLTKTLVRKEKS